MEASLPLLIVDAPNFFSELSGRKHRPVAEVTGLITTPNARVITYLVWNDGWQAAHVE